MPKKYLALLFFLAAGFAHGQSVGAITSTQCVIIDSSNTGTVGISVTGTWSGTLQPGVSTNGDPAQNAQVTPSTSSTAQSTITGNGNFSAQTSGTTIFQICGNTVASGSAQVKLFASVHSRNGGGGGSSGTVTSVSGTANQIDSTGGATPVLSLDPAITLPGTINNLTLTAPATGSTLTVPDGTTQTFPAASGTLANLASAQAFTNKDLTGAGNTFPTFNQNTTGSAAKWTTARLLAGNSTDGSANVPFANAFIVKGTADTGLSGAQFLGALATGIVKVTTTTGTLSTATGADLPAAIPIGSVGSAGLTGASPVTIDSTGAIGCATCVTSGSSLTSTALMTGAGSQASQTPSATSTLSSGGNMSLAGTFSSAGATSTTGADSATVPLNVSQGATATVFPAEAFNITQGSNTGATNVPAINVASTWNNASITGPIVKVAATVTSSTATATMFQLLAGAAGTTNEFQIDKGGVVQSAGSMRTAQANVIGFNSTSIGTAADTAMSRDTADVIDFGNGTAADKSAFLKSGMTVRVASNFTTAANTNLQTITGLSWALPATGTHTFSFHCDGSYSIATGAVAVAFGIQAATNNPTNIFASGQMFTAAGVVTSGTLATLATTTATNIVSGTPGATATNNEFHLAGTIENPAATANTINIMVSTATSADVVTVLRGTFCALTP